MTDQTTLTIEVTTGHCLGGVGNDVYPGQLLVAPKDLPIADVWKKVRQGYARIVPNATEAAAPLAAGPADVADATGPAPITHGNPAVAVRDPEIDAPDPARKSRMQGPRPMRTGGR